VKLYSRSGNDLTERFPLIVQAMARLGANSSIIDGEAVACGDDGIASFDRLCYRHYDKTVFLYAFDLIELNGDDLRREPFVLRKTTLASLLGQEMLAELLGSAIPNVGIALSNLMDRPPTPERIDKAKAAIDAWIKELEAVRA
jgi:ATP-dependent DNA ligase